MNTHVEGKGAIFGGIYLLKDATPKALAYVVIFLPWNGKEFVLLAQVRPLPWLTRKTWASSAEDGWSGI